MCGRVCLKKSPNPQNPFFRCLFPRATAIFYWGFNPQRIPKSPAALPTAGLRGSLRALKIVVLGKVWDAASEVPAQYKGLAPKGASRTCNRDECTAVDVKANGPD